MVSIPISKTFVSTFKWSNIAIIDAVAFIHISKLLSSSQFQLCLYSSNIQANSEKLAEASDLSNIPPKYHEFAKIFSKTKAEVLIPHCSYNLQINLEEGAQSLVGLIYSLLTSRQEKFIEENLNMGFIQPTSSLHDMLVLFIKKKDGSLHLYIDFYGLNYISKKNCYPLLLISNLLNSPHKVWVYTKIDFVYIFDMLTTWFT